MRKSQGGRLCVAPAALRLPAGPLGWRTDATQSRPASPVVGGQGGSPLPVLYVIRVRWLMTSKVTDFTYGLSLRGPYVSALRGYFRAICSACLFNVTVTIIVYRHRNGKDTMKDAHDNLTSDLLPVQRPRGRPRTGKAKTQAERQAAYRARVQAEYLTVRLPKGLVQGLKDAQMKAVRNGSALVALTPLQAGELLKAIRVSERSQQG